MVSNKQKLNFRNYWQPVGVYYLIQFVVGLVATLAGQAIVPVVALIAALLVALGVNQFYETSYWRLLVAIALSVLVIAGGMFLFAVLFGLFTLTI